MSVTLGIRLEFTYQAREVDHEAVAMVLAERMSALCAGDGLEVDGLRPTEVRVSPLLVMAEPGVGDEDAAGESGGSS